MGVLGDGRHGGRGGAAASADCARPLAVLEVNCPKGAREATLGCAPAKNDFCFFAATGGKLGKALNVYTNAAPGEVRSGVCI